MVLANPEVRAVFDRDRGGLVSLQYHGVEMFRNGAGPRLNVYRAPTDNDRWFAGAVRRAGLDAMSRRGRELSARRVRPGLVLVHVVTDWAGKHGVGFEHTADYAVFGNGAIGVANRVVPRGRAPILPKLGILCILPRDFQDFTWLGRGPWENYVDRKRAADVGLWHGTVAQQDETYVRPQENGNKCDVRWAALRDRRGRGLLVVTGGSGFSVSVHRNTPADFARARHIHEISPRPEVVLCVDAAHTGLGGASCGPGPLKKYILYPKPTRFYYSLRPCPAAETRLDAAARQPLPRLDPPEITRDDAGRVRIRPPVPGARIQVRLGSGNPAREYTGPFYFPHAGEVRAWCAFPGGLRGAEAVRRFPKIIPCRILTARAAGTWRIASTDSFQPGEGSPEHAIDGNPATYWHTNWTTKRTKHPHEIVIDLGRSEPLAGFRILPRQDMENGRIRHYAFYVSENPARWANPVAKGRFPNNAQWQTVRFNRIVRGRYVRLVAYDEWRGQYYTSLAELEVLVAVGP